MSKRASSKKKPVGIAIGSEETATVAPVPLKAEEDSGYVADIPVQEKVIGCMADINTINAMANDDETKLNTKMSPSQKVYIQTLHPSFKHNPPNETMLRVNGLDTKTDQTKSEDSNKLSVASSSSSTPKRRGRSVSPAPPVTRSSTAAKKTSATASKKIEVETPRKSEERSVMIDESIDRDSLVLFEDPYNTMSEPMAQDEDDKIVNIKIEYNKTSLSSKQKGSSSLSRTLTYEENDDDDEKKNIQKQQNGHYSNSMHQNKKIKTTSKMSNGEEEEPYKTFICTDHHTIFPLGASSVVIAYDHKHAIRQLDKELKKQGFMTYEEKPYTIVEINTFEPRAYILSTGDLA